jgi:uncharacterized protein YnzC (UPF0291/DUF896 family)
MATEVFRLIPKEIVDRVNYYARKARIEGLTDDEKLEQKQAREAYLEMIRGQVRTMLDNMGTAEHTHQHSDDCDCGCHGKDNQKSH